MVASPQALEYLSSQKKIHSQGHFDSVTVKLICLALTHCQGH